VGRREEIINLIRAVLVREARLKWEQLHVDCAGDEFSPDADGVFSHAPISHFGDGKVRFLARWYDCAIELYGSASAFLSQ
jgi:hypothetical protein